MAGPKTGELADEGSRPVQYCHRGLGSPEHEFGSRAMAGNDVGRWPEGIHWHPDAPSPLERLDPTREGWLRQYVDELASGRWGDVLDIWFDSPAADGIGDRPWEPCAIAFRRDGRYVIVSEDYSANPRRLREYAHEGDYPAAHEVVHRLRPWHVR